MLQLEVKDKVRVCDSLKDIIKPEVLEANNAYLCGVCGKKVSAQKQQRIVSFPNILLLHLKRFEAISNSQHKKINSFYEFPLELDMLEYASMSKEESSVELINESYKYNLKGVIIHIGSLNFGHYFSLAKDDKTEHWIQFNDTIIEKFDIKNLAEEAFGSSLRNSQNKSNSAYILIYQRTNIKPINKTDSETINSINMSDTLISSKLERKFKDEYITIIERKLAFNPSYLEFVMGIFKDFNWKSNAILNKNDQLKFLGYGLHFFLTILLRSNDTKNMFEFAKIIENACNENEEFAENVVGSFSSLLILREFLLDCPKATARKCAAEILKLAIDHVHKVTSKDVKKYMAGETSKAPSLVYLTNTFLKQLTLINKNTCGEYFSVLARLIKLGLYKCALNYPLLGVIFECMRLPTKEKWGKLKSNTLPNLAWKEQSIIPLSEKLSAVLDNKIIEKQFALQFPYMIEAVSELIKDYREGIDYIEIERINNETIKRLYTFGSLNMKGQLAIAELIITLAQIENGKHKDKLFEILISRVRTCTSIELPVILLSIQRLFDITDESTFYNTTKRLVGEIMSELKSYCSEEYFTIICYADFILNLVNCHHKCLEYSEIKSLLEKLHKKLEYYKSLKNSITLFRYMSITINTDNTRIANLIRGANNERIEKLNKIKKGKPEVKEPTLNIMQENIKEGADIDVYMYFNGKSIEKRVIVG